MTLPRHQWRKYEREKEKISATEGAMRVYIFYWGCLNQNFDHESYDPRKDLIESIQFPETISVKVLESTEAHKDLSKFNVKFRLPLDLRKLEDISGKSF